MPVSRRHLCSRVRGSSCDFHYAPQKSSGISAYGDPTKNDNADYDDPLIRQIAVNALGHANGSVLAMDPLPAASSPSSIRRWHFLPARACSTIKPVIALAGLQEGVITRDTMLQVGHRRYMDLTEAMAHSNNVFFEQVGTRLGFPRVDQYASWLAWASAPATTFPKSSPVWCLPCPRRMAVSRACPVSAKASA